MGMALPHQHTYDGSAVKAWSERIVIPTYPVGGPDRNPMFLEQRVYQGSSGAVYPYRMIHTVSDQKCDRSYEAVFLENRYLKIMILPELGGRVQMALDKSNDYHFVYYNRVIKPALVGLTGPWIAGGIEFNWPQHHRPTTFAPTEFEIETEAGGSATVWVGEWEPMYRTRSTVGFRLHPERALLEIDGRLSNPTPLAQTFLWWANPAVPVNEHYQAVFPPDVNAVFDHGKRDLTDFPIATGSYYKVDYSGGVDISWYKNVPVPTSYMAYHSEYDFLGGYDHRRACGLLHVADHHVSPGKKMWTWGTSEFARAWERNLTDEDGPYVELMAGVFTDNQPDFSWLQPGEEKRFVQYFLPFQGVFPVCAASERVVLGVGANDDASATVAVYASESMTVRVTIEREGAAPAERRIDVDPSGARTWRVPDLEAPERCTYRVYDPTGRLLLRYPVEPTGTPPVPKKAQAAPDPTTVGGNEELVLWGRHLEQYRHATFSPEPYYQEALRRDPGDSRANDALGLRQLKRGDLARAERSFRVATERLLAQNPNPYDGEPLFHLALALWYQGKLDEAYDWFYKATWNYATKSYSLLFLARIAATRGELGQALQFLDAALDENGRNLPAVHLRSVVLRKLGRNDEARRATDESLARFPINHLGTAERLLHDPSGRWPASLATKPHLMLEIALAYGHAGFTDDALHLIERYLDGGDPDALVLYLKAHYHRCRAETDDARTALHRAEKIRTTGAFPNQLDIAVVLAETCASDAATAMAAFQLGNYCYAHGDFARAHELWSATARSKPDFPTAHRNLALSFFNKKRDPTAALTAMERAFDRDPTDAQILLELDALSNRVNRTPESRLELLEAHLETVLRRDDGTITYVTLLNLVGRHEEAHRTLTSRRFHPWEGGEGKVSEQYKRALIEMAKRDLAAQRYRAAVERLEAAKRYPPGLGEGKLPTAEADNEIDFWLGCAHRCRGDEAAAQAAFTAASGGDETPELSLYYNDRPADAIFFQALAWRLLGREDRACRLLCRLGDYGADHAQDPVEVDYFAVSLPDMLVFDEDLDRRNERFCRYLLALGRWGMGSSAEARRELERVRASDCAHQGAAYTLPLVAASIEDAQAGPLGRMITEATTPRSGGR